MPRDDLEESFPGLRTAEYRVTSPPDANYNCVAWAAGDSQRWWDPALEPGYFWPPRIARTLTLANLVAALATLGFEPGADDSLEPEFEKLVIYSDDHGWPTHVARQLPSGSWTSKLGPSEDIEHSTVQAFEGAIYGKVVQVLRRTRSIDREA
jgi:hypothetical protein